ncbi:hypothetical protein F2P81_015526 [Scophthalmus maximus]|uniref:Uncharacterized protein n=1 Tax=Scophthalmus maximus TaxID=52904 RepID=A0A6A4SDM2_SCOMX|nr:hypothetical protein F2P81_015526 [Scophthalmus maximus]
MEPGSNRNGAGIEPGSKRNQTGIEPETKRDPTWMEPGLKRNPTGMEQGSNRDGTRIKPGWNRDQIGMEPGSNQDQNTFTRAAALRVTRSRLHLDGNSRRSNDVARLRHSATVIFLFMFDFTFILPVFCDVSFLKHSTRSSWFRVTLWDGARSRHSYHS